MYLQLCILYPKCILICFNYRACHTDNRNSKKYIRMFWWVYYSWLYSNRKTNSCWYKDGVELTSSNHLTITNTTNGSYVQRILTISSLIEADEGIYKCIATNKLPNGTATQSSSLKLEVVNIKCMLKAHIHVHVHEFYIHYIKHTNSIIWIPWYLDNQGFR